jgi:hypothetical protein
MKPRTLISLLTITTCLALSACGGGNADEVVACTTEFRSSVVITVVDAASAPIPNAEVTYLINGGPAQSLVCGATGVCGVGGNAQVGKEQDGRFTLFVSKPGFVTTGAEVQVNRDACHVQTEQLRIVLRSAT